MYWKLVDRGAALLPASPNATVTAAYLSPLAVKGAWTMHLTGTHSPGAREIVVVPVVIHEAHDHLLSSLIAL